MELEENLVSEELLEEADIALCSNFTKDTWFELPVMISRIPEKAEESAVLFDVKAPRRSLSSIEAELHVCQHLGWEPILHIDQGLYNFQETYEIIKRAANICGRKVAVALGALTKNELALIRPYVSSLIVRLETVNKGIQKRIIPQKLLLGYLMTFGEARDFERGIELTLGIGETLEDISELVRFISTHDIGRVTFFVAQQKMLQKRSSSSFYIARWIAETRINFPKIKIAAGTWVQRQAEVGLFLRAGANAITQFPALRYFNSEYSRVIESECANAKRRLRGTLSDHSRLESLDRSLIKEEVRGKLDKYIAAMKRI